MGILSSIRDFGSSVGVLTRLCNIAWTSVGGEEKMSLFFKPNKTLLCVVNGKSTTISYIFIANSNSLIINDLNGVGSSYHLKYIDEYALILIDEENCEDLCFGNKNATKLVFPLQSKVDVYRLYFSNQLHYLLERKQHMIDYIAIDDIDKVTNGLNEDDAFHCIDVFRKHMPDFDIEYSLYLWYYQKEYVPGWRGGFADRLLSSLDEDTYRSSYFDKLKNPRRESKVLNAYIEANEDLRPPKF